EALKRTRGQRMMLVEIARFWEGIHGTLVLAYPGFHQEVLRLLARSTATAQSRCPPVAEHRVHGRVWRRCWCRFVGGNCPLCSPAAGLAGQVLGLAAWHSIPRHVRPRLRRP